VVTIGELNEEPPEQAAERLRACNAAPRFAAELLAARPYPDAATLAGRAGAVARALPWDDVLIALAAHPRIGDRVAGTSAEAASSRQEQSSMADADAAVRAALLEGNRAYEQRFGHVFLICATGLSAEAMLAALRSRLRNDPVAEREVVRGELVKIVRLRLAKAFR
jgi:2-oxo-4-hydroxy-4-carboxy-5-ureidoimidazoline decarboxylase